MRQAKICTGCRYPLLVPDEFTGISTACPKCGKLVHRSNVRRASAIMLVVRHLAVGWLMFMIGVAFANAIIEGPPPTEPRGSSGSPTQTPFPLDASTSG